MYIYMYIYIYTYMCVYRVNAERSGNSACDKKNQGMAGFALENECVYHLNCPSDQQ